jgi:SAM-dependent methyltransferase
MNAMQSFSWRLRLLAEAHRAGGAFAEARRIGLPGQDFYRLGRSLGWKLFRMGDKHAQSLLRTPVNITRYFEFDFAWRALALDEEAPCRCLDVSSPFLFSLAVARHCPVVEVRMLNPAAWDVKQARHVVERTCWPRIRCVQAGVEALEGESGVYDAIWSISVVEHIAGDRGDDRDAVRLMWQALRPGGRLILTVPTDKLARDEYRDDDPYGTQPKSADSGAYFFQRFYDEQAIQTRIVDEIGCAPALIEWFGEKVPGHFNAYIDRWRREGSACTVDDPLDIAMNYQPYPSHSAMPGVGVCGLSFVKP